MNANERENDIVTVSKLQVALDDRAIALCTYLSDLAVVADTETTEGLWQLLQSVVEVLREHSQCWTHVLATSKTLDSREDAETWFNLLSVEEREKFSAQTLVNVDGEIVETPAPPLEEDDESGECVVVTLLLGTADDRPLFDEITASSELTRALERIEAISPDDLMVFELLWSPQAAGDRLSKADLRDRYGDLIAID